MARLITLTFPASNSTLFATTISGSAGLITSLNYPLTFTNFARTLTLTSADNNSAVTFTIVGTNQYGNVQTENLTGPNASTVTSINSYNTITSISANGNYTNLSIGSGSIGRSLWVPVNTLNVYPSITISCEITDTINYTINQTIDKLQQHVNVSSNPGAGSTPQFVINTNVISFPVTANLTGASTNQIFTLTTPTNALQAIINSSTAGTLTVNILQQGII